MRYTKIKLRNNKGENELLRQVNGFLSTENQLRSEGLSCAVDLDL